MKKQAKVKKAKLKVPKVIKKIVKKASKAKAKVKTVKTGKAKVSRTKASTAPVVRPLSYLQTLVRKYYQIQEHRLATEAQSRMSQDANAKQLLDAYASQFKHFEVNLKKDVAKAVHAEPMWNHFFKGVKGIGELFAGVLLATVDIYKAQHVSSIWKYAGLAPNQCRKKGQKLDYNAFLKKTCYLIGESFVKSKGQYRKIYDTSKIFYKNKFPKPDVRLDEKGKIIMTKDGKPRMFYSDGHIHAMSKRRTVKLFLSDMYVAWRTLEGLSVSVPFMHKGVAEQEAIIKARNEQERARLKGKK